MKNVTPDEIAELLDRQEYRVVVQATDGGCLTHFPKRVELPTPGFVRLYQEFLPTGVLTCEYDENGAEMVKYETPCPIYAQRLYMLYQVIFHCMGIGYDIAFIKFIVNKEEVDEDNFFLAHKSPFALGTETTQETKLRQLLSDCFMRGFQPVHGFAAKNEGIEDGYVAIRRIFVPDQMMNQIEQAFSSNPFEETTDE